MSGKLTYSEEALGHLDKLTDFLIRQAGERTALSVIDELLDSVTAPKAKALDFPNL